MDRMLPALRAFQEAARLKSFQEAARALGVTPSAVSHRIRALEADLGAPLFIRRTRSLALTAEGEALYAGVEPAFRALTGALGAARRTAGGARLKVSALPFITNHWLIPRLAGFKARRPGIAIEIESANRLADFETDGVDVAIRNGAPPPSGLFVRKLIDVRPEVLCAPALRDGPRPIRTPADLSGHTLIHIAPRQNAWSVWLAAAGYPGLTPRGEITFDSVPAALEAAAAGQGVTLAWAPMVWDSPAADRLVPPFPPLREPGGAYFVVCRRADRARAPVRAFVDWIVAEMAADRPRLARLDAARRLGPLDASGARP